MEEIINNAKDYWSAMITAMCSDISYLQDSELYVNDGDLTNRATDTEQKTDSKIIKGEQQHEIRNHQGGNRIPL